MQYFLMWTPAANAVSAQPPTPGLMADLGAYMAEVGEATVMAGGLLPLAQGARVDVTGPDVVVTDGPFAEAKEVVAGFSIIESDSKAQVVEWARRFAQIHADHGWEGVCEVRPMMVSGPPDA